MQLKRSVWWTCLFVGLVCLFGPRLARAQGSRGRLVVTVTDQTGGVLPGAVVRITGLENATRAAAVAPVTATTLGVATFEGLAVGRYSVEADFTGFTRGVVRDTRVRAGDNRLTLALALRTMTDEVTVGRDRQEVTADRGVSFGTALTREQIDALSEDPNELRQQLMDMAGPGAVISVDSFEGGQLPPKSQIRSVRIARDQFAAENHGAGIGRIEIVTQPGIGPLRGSITTNFYDSALDGRNPLIGQTSTSQSRGLNAGLSGTLLKEKMSFSISGSGGTSYFTPVLTSSVSTASVARSSTLRSPSDNQSIYASVDYAVTRDQTLRFNLNRFSGSSKNQGVGVYDEDSRAFSTSNSNTGVYVQQTGPLGRRFALNSRLSLTMSNQSSRAALEAPTVMVTDAFTVGGAQRAGSTRTKSMQLASDLDYVRGLHSVRVGVLADVYDYRSDANTNYLGTYTFESLTAFAAGQPRSYTRRTGDPNVRFTSVQAGFYVQDDIRVRRNLSLSPGLRYEVQSNVPDRVNLAPRFGFTWSPFRSGRTSIRSSIGVFYDWLNNGTYQQSLLVDGFRQQEVNLRNPTYPDPGALGASPPTNRYLLSDTMTMPRTLRLSLGLSHTFTQRFSASGLYTDSWGRALLVGQNLNAPVGLVRPDPRFANVIEAVSAGRLRQRALNANVSINLAQLSMAPPTGGPLFDWRRGLRVGVGHTVLSLENNTDGPFATPATGDLDAEWGPGAGDVRHRANLSLGTGAIRGLSAQMSINTSSASPVTIRTGFDDNGDLIFNDRPAGVGRNSERTTGQWNSSASFSYTIPFGSRTVNTGSGVAVMSQGGGLVVTQLGSQSIARYRLLLAASIQNLFNRANYVGYSGVVTSPNYLKPSSVQGVRRISFNMGLTF